MIREDPTETPPSLTSSTVPINDPLPFSRLIGERDVPGEGPSWLYEDGTTCRKVIDGDPVNAQWGVTKADKPRKRLAIACTTPQTMLPPLMLPPSNTDGNLMKQPGSHPSRNLASKTIDDRRRHLPPVPLFQPADPDPPSKSE